MHVKSEKLKRFWYKKKGNLLFKKVKESDGKEKWVQEEGDQENKKIKRKGNEKGGECETWWTKTKSDEKRMRKTWLKKNTKKERNSFSKYGRVFFLRERDTKR